VYGQPGYGQPAYGPQSGYPGSSIPAGIQFASMPLRLGARVIDAVLVNLILGVVTGIIAAVIYAAGGFDNIQTDPVTDEVTSGADTVGLLVDRLLPAGRRGDGRLRDRE
jgi:hypothetical protein